MTFSIIAIDKKNGDLGGAVASKLVSVGSLVTHAKHGIGLAAVLTGRSKPIRFKYGEEALKLLAKGYDAHQVLEHLLKVDNNSEEMQISIIDIKGKVACFTGRKMPPWCGHLSGEGFSVQGNTLAGSIVVEKMFETFKSKSDDLATRLAISLESGDLAGGDRRGKQAAGLLVLRDFGGAMGFNDDLVNIRVDDHPEPVKELLRLKTIFEEAFRSKRVWSN